MKISYKLREALENLEPIDDKQERLSLLVDMGSSQEWRLPEAERTEENRIKGCVSAAWLAGSLENGQCRFRCAADSPLVLGLLGYLCSFFSGLEPNEVRLAQEDPLSSLGVKQNLSATRQNGLTQARERIRQIATALS